MSTKYLHIQLFVFFIASTAQALAFCLACCHCGEVLENNPYVLTTQQLVLYCNLHNETVQRYGLTAADVEFRRGNDKPYTSDVYVINETTLMLNRTVHDLSDKGTYYCQIKEGKRQNFTHHFVGRQSVKVEFYPQPISPDTVRCEVYDWDKYLNCSWTTPNVTYVQPSDIQTSVQWANFDTYHMCTNITDNTCFVKGAPLDVGSLHIKFVIYNTRANISVETIYTFQADEFVKPSPVSSFTSQVINSTCVRLHWQHPRQHRQKFFEILYKSKWDETEMAVNTTSQVYTSEICSLVPHTLYNFSIGVYSSDHARYRSELVHASSVTKEDEPAVPPEMMEGSYVGRLDQCGQGKMFRNVTIYWKSIPEKLHYGVLTRYYITYQSDDPLDAARSFEHVDPSEFSKDIILHCEKSYEISIKSGTKVGLSDDASTIHVLGSDDKEISPPSEIIPVIVSKSFMNISWIVPKSDWKITGFTVYWCQHKIKDICLKEIEWKQVDATELSTVIDIDKYTNTDLSFGVSIETSKMSSGLRWESCIYKKDAVPKAPAIKLGESPPNRGLAVTWTRVSCEGDSPYILGYKVRFCESNLEQNECAGHTRDSSLIPSTGMLRYDIENLDPGKRYLIKVRSVARNSESIDSTPVSAVPLDNSFKFLPGQLAGIIIAAVFVFVLSVAGVVFCYRYFKKKAADYKKPYPIDVPKVAALYKPIANGNGHLTTGSEPSSPVDNKSINIVLNGGPPQLPRQLSKDSGHESLTSDVPVSPLPDAVTNNKSREQQANGLHPVMEESDQSSGGLTSRRTEESSLSTSRYTEDSSKPLPHRCYSKLAVVVSSGAPSEESSIAQSSENLIDLGRSNPGFVPQQEIVIPVGLVTDIILDNPNPFYPTCTKTGDLKEPAIELTDTPGAESSSDRNTDTLPQEIDFDQSDISGFVPQYMKTCIASSSGNTDIALMEKDEKQDQESLTGEPEYAKGYCGSFVDGGYRPNMSVDRSEEPLSDYIKNDGINGPVADCNFTDYVPSFDSGSSAENGDISGNLEQSNDNLMKQDNEEILYESTPDAETDQLAYVMDPQPKMNNSFEGLDSSLEPSTASSTNSLQTLNENLETGTDAGSVFANLTNDNRGYMVHSKPLVNENSDHINNPNLVSSSTNENLCYIKDHNSASYIDNENRGYISHPDPPPVPANENSDHKSDPKLANRISPNIRYPDSSLYSFLDSDKSDKYQKTIENNVKDHEDNGVKEDLTELDSSVTAGESICKDESLNKNTSLVFDNIKQEIQSDSAACSKRNEPVNHIATSGYVSHDQVMSTDNSVDEEYKSSIS